MHRFSFVDPVNGRYDSIMDVQSIIEGSGPKKNKLPQLSTHQFIFFPQERKEIAVVYEGEGLILMGVRMHDSQYPP